MAPGWRGGPFPANQRGLLHRLLLHTLHIRKKRIGTYKQHIQAKVGIKPLGLATLQKLAPQGRGRKFKSRGYYLVI